MRRVQNFVKLIRSSGLVFLALLMSTASTVWAQTAPPPPANPSPQSYEVDFAADQLAYDNEADVVTASGNVAMVREGNRLSAAQVVWDRKTGRVTASGGVAVTNPGGDVAYGDSIELTDTLKDGVVENLLIVLQDGGRLAAIRGTRNNGVSTLERAVYSPCRVEDEAGCPKDPVWKISAIRVQHDPVKNRIYYKNARLELFGLPILALPGFSHPADDRGGTGLLIPDIQYTRNNGFELSAPFFVKIAPNRDLTLTPHIFTDALPAIETRYRALTGNGAYQIGTYATYGSRLPNTVGITNTQRDFRGYVDANGRFQIDKRWSVNSSIRLVTDRTFLRRYDISRDDRLRSNFELQRLTRTSYFSLVGWGFQTLRQGDPQGQVPIVLPAIDYRKRIDAPIVGGKVELQLNSLALGRTDGQDTQRAFGAVRWDLRRLTPLGQEIQLTAFGRGDVYHSDENIETLTNIYRGRSGWQGRVVAAAAAEIRWPFVGPFLGGTQRLTPRLQVVASPDTRNLSLPNEDARAVDLEDSNLFALNRFPGYDRWEDGTRITYGADWAIDLPQFSIQANIGQSYRLSSKPTIFPNGTGLTSRTSDIVGRTTVKFKRAISFTHRYRLDKDNLAIRRNEIDATIGSDTTYAVVGYLRLNRDVDPAIEDLRDREEIRLGGRAQIARYWSVFGSTIVDLTGRQEDPVTLTDGYEPIRHRIGVAYEDDCLRIGLTWRRDYDASGDARRGNTFQLKLSFRNLGR
jgi:LPS-assembly protein